MSLLPHNDSAQSPFVWLVNLDEGAGFAGSLEMAIADGPERENVEGPLACFELGGWGEVASTQPVVPRLVAFAEAVRWRVTDGALIAGQPVSAPSGRALRPASRVFPGMTWDDMELGAADEALLLDFALTCFSKGSGGTCARAEFAAIGEAEWTHVEWLRAVRAVYDWHPVMIAGSGTTRLVADAPLFTSFPPAEDPEDERMGDLFAEAAE